MALLSTKFWLVGVQTGPPIPPIPTTYLPEPTSARDLKPYSTAGRELKPLPESALADYVPPPTPPAELKPDLTSGKSLEPDPSSTRDLRPTITKATEE